jgi:hypothetical protein
VVLFDAVLLVEVAGGVVTTAKIAAEKPDVSLRS